MNSTSESSGHPLRVLVSGCFGKMGSEVARAVHRANDLVLVGGFDPAFSGKPLVVDAEEAAPAYAHLDEALNATRPDVMVEFTLPNVAALNLQTALAKGIDCVLGTSGVPTATLEELATEAPAGTGLFYAPNYTTGAVLMMAASKLAASFFEDVEVIEFHHNNKKDAPSGTAVATAELIASERALKDTTSSAPGSETELPGFSGARGTLLPTSDVRIHSVRSNGFVASQEVIFGSPGQSLTIRHDSFDRSSYMPGVLLAIRSVGALSGLIIGLEELMQL